MCEYLDYDIVELKRIRIINNSLDLPVGEWRYLDANEIAHIKETVSDSSENFDNTIWLF
jgi:23S rRNA pseudouridine2604 synthase